MNSLIKISRAQFIFLLIIATLFSNKGSAQDIHFSQFYNSPFNLNPALTGQFNGAYRIVGNQRTQWRSVTVPYSTFGIGADAHQLVVPDGLLNKRDGNGIATGLNTGLSFFNDKAGDSHLKTTIINLALGTDIPVGTDKSAHISPALMLGFTSMRIDYSELHYDNQWNGLVYDPTINPNETYPRSSRGYLNFNLGMCYFKTWNKTKEFIAGASLFNIGNPHQSFFNDGYVKLDSRLNIHGQYRFPLNDQWQAEPMTMFMSQGTYKEFNIGGLVHYILEDKSWMHRTIYGGLFARAKDAGYLTAGMKYDDWNVGLSYDLNTSNLRPASSGRGGFELSVIYIIPPKPRAFPVPVCPDYM